MEEISDRIGLGTVQFGLDYGINNKGGKVSFEEVNNIISEYHKTKNPLYDSAIAYGDSQIVLGNTFEDLSIKNPSVVSKFTIQKKGGDVKVQLKKALADLKIDHLFAFIAHNANALIGNFDLIEELQELKAKGFIKKIGISSYFPKEVDWFLENSVPIDLIQVPYNFFDQRFEEVISTSKKQGVEIHVRSAFLQGIIFKPLDFFNSHFSALKDKVQLLHMIRKKTNLTLSQIAISFCLMQKDIDKIIIGVDSKSNLIENLNFSYSPDLLKQLKGIKEELAVTDEHIILPFNWPKL